MKTDSPMNATISCNKPLQWRHNERNGVSNHQPVDCLLNRLFTHRLKKTSKLRVTGLCEGNSRVTGNSSHKGPVTRKMFPFDDAIMQYHLNYPCCNTAGSLTHNDESCTEIQSVGSGHSPAKWQSFSWIVFNFNTLEVVDIYMCY